MAGMKPNGKTKNNDSSKPAVHVRSPVRKATFGSPSKAPTAAAVAAVAVVAASVANRIYAIAIHQFYEIVLILTDSSSEKGGWLHPFFKFLDLPEN